MSARRSQGRTGAVRRRRTAVAVAALVIALGPLSPALPGTSWATGTQADPVPATDATSALQPPPLPPDPATAPSVGLFRQADALDAQRVTADATLAVAVADAAPVEERLGAAQARADALAEDDHAARQRLSTLAVSAYVSGGVVPDDLVVEVLTAEQSSSEHEQRLVMVSTVTDALVEQRRGTARALAEARTELAEATRASDEAGGRVDAGRAERDRLAAAATDARRRAEAARTDEDLQRFAYAVWVAELRARTPAPQPHRSGVVPPPAAPADLVGRLAGTMPRTSLEAYWRAASVLGARQPGCHIDWALLAAVGHVETGHGTHRGARPAPDGSVEPVILGPVLDGNGFERITDSDAGRYDGDPIMDRAVGPMQFIPTTWRAYGADGNGDGVADPHNIYDGSLAAATMLCRNGRGDLREPARASAAVRSYNNSSRYVVEVLSLAEHYRGVADPDRNLPPPTVDPDAELPDREPTPDAAGDGDPVDEPTTTTTAIDPTSSTTTGSTTTTEPPTTTTATP